MARNKLGRLAALLLVVGTVALSSAGCVLVPAPVPVARSVVVAPPPVVVVPRPIYGYGYYRPYYGRRYYW